MEIHETEAQLSAVVSTELQYTIDFGFNEFFGDDTATSTID